MSFLPARARLTGRHERSARAVGTMNYMDY
jgi:hypothetical protein